MTLLRPDAGRATVLGKDAVRDFRDLRQRIGYMAGRFSLYPDLSVEENIADGYEHFRYTDARVGSFHLEADSNGYLMGNAQVPLPK